MAWSGTNTVQDRIFGSLLYVLPLIDLIIFQHLSPYPAGSLIGLIPGWGTFLALISPLVILYGSNWIISLGIFFALFAFVIRNENVSRFIRFNAMQAILLGIVMTLVRLVRDFILGPAVGVAGESGSFIMDTVQNTVFLGVVAVLAYCFVQTARGLYPDKIPSLSEIVHMQVR